MAKPKQRSVSVERLIAAPAEKIFAVLTDPSRHCEIDGSGTLARLTTSNAPLTLGSTFSMRIKVGVSYTVKNRVLEFEERRAPVAGAVSAAIRRAAAERSSGIRAQQQGACRH